MSTAVRESTSSHISRKIMSHGGPISGQSHGTGTASLENNLDALLEDLQTSVSRSATPSRGRTHSPQVEYRTAANPTRVVSECRTISPTRGGTTTLEKYVSTGPAGSSCGIPGLEELDAELQDVQPGQSKTVAYKQVSYQYNKALDGKPIDSWAMSDNALTAGDGSPLIDDIRETTYEESRSQSRRHRSPEPIGKTSTVSRELLWSDSTTSHSKQPSPLPGTQRDLKIIQETTGYQAEPRSSSVTIQKESGVEYVPVPSSSPAVPINLAPGPNTKVTTTIKTYTYELPGAPETYLPGGSLPRGVDQTISYTLPSGDTYTTDKMIAYQSSSENIPAVSSRYGSTSPDITKKTTTYHKEAKFYREDHVGGPISSPSVKTVYPSPSSNVDTRTTVTRNDKYYQVDGTYLNGHGPVDYPDHPNVIYQNQPPIINESRTTTINRIEEHYPNRPPSGGRYPIQEKPGTPTKMTHYYPQQQEQQTSTSVYKYSSNTSRTIPPNRNADDHETLLPKPFPTGGVQVYPQKASSPNGEGPPKKLEDLMASFSDSEQGVFERVERRERETHKTGDGKKEVEFVAHTPPKVKSKNVAGPPVYYPPGSGEFTKKEEYGASMSQSGGAWQKASGKYEYEASSKSKSKSSSGKAVVPVCLPLCCALPCVIM